MNRSRTALRSLVQLVVLLLPAAVILIAAALTPMTEFSSNQGDVGYYLDRARAVAAGQMPYRDFPFEYPPLAVLPMALPSLIWPAGPVELDQYRWLFAVWEAILVLGLGLVLTRIRRLGGRFDRAAGDSGVLSVGSRLTVLSIGAALAIAWRFDLFPALLVTLALWAALAGRPTAAGIVLALGVLAKVYPIAVLPALAAGWLVPFDGRRLFRLGLAFPATVALGLLPFVALAGASAFGFLGYQVQRGLQVESIGGGLVLLVGLLGGIPATILHEFGSVEVIGPLATAWLGLLPLVTVVGFGWLAWLGWRRIRAQAASVDGVRPSTTVALTTASVLLLLVTNKVFSIQYVVWIVPFAVLLPRRQFWLAAAIVALTMPIHPFLYADLVKLQALPILVLNARNALLMILTAWVIRDLAENGLARPAGLEPTTFRSAT